MLIFWVGFFLFWFFWFFFVNELIFQNLRISVHESPDPHISIVRNIMPIQMPKIQFQTLIRSSQCASESQCVWVYMCMFCSFASILFTSYGNLYNDTSVQNIWHRLIHFLVSLSVPVKGKETVSCKWQKKKKIW